MSDVVKGTAKPSTTKPTQLSTTTPSKEVTPTPTATPANTSSSSLTQVIIQFCTIAWLKKVRLPITDETETFKALGDDFFHKMRF